MTGTCSWSAIKGSLGREKSMTGRPGVTSGDRALGLGILRAKKRPAENRRPRINRELQLEPEHNTRRDASVVLSRAYEVRQQVFRLNQTNADVFSRIPIEAPAHGHREGVFRNGSCARCPFWAHASG